nr:NADH dehydrogenase subunit 1 [Secretargas transgariepinus]QLD97101.1 NADH dehydrogenase subunit 1 [Secretargas transgariepinus]
MSVMSYLLLVLVVLVSVAFFTLLERKVLGFIHIRKGPNSVGYVGLFQPFSDVIKLFCKEMNFMKFMNLLIFLMVPFLSLFLMLMFWIVFFWEFDQVELEYAFLFFLCISSLSIYVVLLGGWSSNSKYALLGSFRGLAQIISYEVSLAMLVISLLFLCGDFKLSEVVSFQDECWMLWGFFTLFIVWFVSLLAETNRSPFDLSEGESELVSGFNVEYGSYGFAILFMAEYGNIIFMSFITCILFFGGMGVLCMYLIMIMFFFLLVRGTLVRFRYDKLMIMAWSVILPFSILSLFFLFSIKLLFIFYICVKMSKGF